MMIGAVSVGDSTTYMTIAYPYQALGVAALAVPQDVGRELFRILSPTPSPAIVFTNLAISGSRIGDLSSQAATYVNPLTANRRNPFAPSVAAVGHEGSPTGDRKFILSVLIGTNPTSVDPATQAALTGAYCLAAKSNGWDKVMLGTIWSRTDGIIANFDTSYQQPLNAIFRGGAWQAANGVDAIFDLAADVRLGGLLAANNTTYFSDRVHPTVAGHAIAAPIWLAPLNSLRAALANGG